MAIELVSVDPSDTDALASFLKKHFGLQDDAAPLKRANMGWKYFAPRPDWNGSRSYLLKSGERWLAHACVSPMPLERQGEHVRAILLVDWVSAAPGAGAEIYKRFYPRIDALFGNGGSSGARRTIEGLKYPVVGSVDLFARPLKPWRLFLSRKSTGMGGPAARLARDIVAIALPLHSTSGWRTEPVREFAGQHASLCAPDSQALYWQTERSPELLNYFLQCPYARVTGHVAMNKAQPRGYFLLADFGEEIRVAELRVQSESTEDWAAMIALATQVASKTNASYITASTTLEAMRAALRTNGFRWIQKDPLYLYDPQGRIQDKVLHITPFDGDQAYL